MGGSHPLREGGQHRDMLERIKPHLSCCALWLTLPPLTRASGGYIKRDGRPRDAETLVSRLVDRPIRPMFTPGWANETQVLQWVVSYDGVNSPEPVAITAAAAALLISGLGDPRGGETVNLEITRRGGIRTSSHY
jgi:hypothetical protein